ncbi:MAG: hypothetical protein GX777_09455 [Fastidiosipila sp.]|nr:hypothetical protein [Fastidiosipila sp.]
MKKLSGNTCGRTVKCLQNTTNKVINAKLHVKPHVIKFAFTLGDAIERFS